MLWVSQGGSNFDIAWTSDVCMHVDAALLWLRSVIVRTDQLCLPSTLGNISNVTVYMH